jgi:hypothetical protein
MSPKRGISGCAIHQKKSLVMVEMGNVMVCADCNGIDVTATERMRAYNQKPEVKERKRAYMRAYNQKPEVKERKRAYMRAYNQKRRSEEAKKIVLSPRMKRILEITEGRVKAELEAHGV